MNRTIRYVAIALAVVAAVPAWAVTCSFPTLKAASGVIGNKHSYKMTGSCSYTAQQTKTVLFSSTTTNYGLSFSYTGSASWDRQSGVAKETVQFKGDSVGERAATATCTQDPFLKDPPGGAAQCGKITVQAEVESGGIYNALITEQFWAGRKFSLAEAQALSALPPPGQPPPAEKPKPQVATSRGTAPTRVSGEVAAPAASGTTVYEAPPQDVAGRAAVIEQMQRPADGAVRAVQPTAPSARVRVASPGGSPPDASAAGRRMPDAASTGGRAASPDARPVQMEFEAEGLVRAGAVQVAGGDVLVQPMGNFGGGWSGGEQLFWGGGSVGAVLDLVIDVPAPAQYAVEIYMTRAPDYGRVKFEIDGKGSELVFDGMNTEVRATGPQQLGKFPLQAGQRRVSLMIIGRYKDSTGYAVGIDKIRLYPAGPID